MKKNSTTHKIALYVRVSTEEQASNPEGSIKSQEQRLHSAVDFKNLEANFGKVTAVFVDKARSGKDTNRAELQRLLSAIKEKEVTLVMVTEISRLSRSLKDFCSIWDLMREHGCEFQSLREQFDTTTAAGEMVLYTVANIAQFERRQVSERVTANFIARAQRGLYNGGTIPLGYKLDPEKKGYLFVEEDTAPLVQEIFRTFLQEKSLPKTARALNERGLRLKQEMINGRTSRLPHFAISNLHCILKNEAYIGLRPYKIKGEAKVAKASWQPLVDEVTFGRVQELLQEQ